MIVVQEVHDVAGRDEDAFDLALRDSWAPALAESGEARLVWALRPAGQEPDRCLKADRRG